jgi:hypothetical protein
MEREQCGEEQMQRIKMQQRAEIKRREDMIKSKASAVMSSASMLYSYVGLKSLLKNHDVARRIVSLLHDLVRMQQARICMEGEFMLLHGMAPDQQLQPNDKRRYDEQISQEALQELVAKLRVEKEVSHQQRLQQVECYIPTRVPPKAWDVLLREIEQGDDCDSTLQALIPKSNKNKKKGAKKGRSG